MKSISAAFTVGIACWCALAMGQEPAKPKPTEPKRAETKPADPQPEEVKLPDPPEGFRWEMFKAMDAGFLAPKDWFVKREEVKATSAGFITKEDISKVGKFKTGLTVNYVRDVEKRTGHKPTVLAELLTKTSTEGKKVSQLPATRAQDRIKTTTFRVETEGIVMHTMMVADDKFNTLHIVIFESPAKEWDEAWKSGETMLKKVYLKSPD